ncbi:MAG: SprT family zinc-dependent metalloprotease [Azospirillaceae bacterium]
MSVLEDSAGATAEAVVIRRSARTRRLTLRIDRHTGRAVVTAPPEAPKARIQRFLHAHAEWLREQRGALPPPIPIDVGSVLPLRGVPHQVVAGVARGRPVEVAQGRIVVNGAPEHRRRRLLDFLRQEARTDLAAAVARHTQRLGLRHSGMTVRDTRSRWGSCTAKGHLNFSWRLILAPDHVLDYLAAHEVAHLRHRHHKASFWQTVETLHKEYRAAEMWLKTKGGSLQRFRVED